MSLGNVEQISDALYLNKHIQDFGKIQEIDSIEFNDSKIKSLGNIKNTYRGKTVIYTLSIAIDKNYIEDIV